MESTTNYGLFKTLAGNRRTDINHVERLAKAIDRKDLLSEYPILVNEQFEIIDGQHRLMAAAKLGVPVYYKKVKGLSLTNVQEINTASRSWGVQDFVESYIQLGRQDYEDLKNFSTTYGLGYSLAASLMMGVTQGLDGGGASAKIRNGSFHINSRVRAKSVAVALSEINRFADFNALADRNLARAIWNLQGNEDFSTDRLLGKFQTHNLVLKKRHNERYYILQLEEIYNFNAKDRATLYVGQA